MYLEKHGNQWRAKIQYKGKLYRASFDHKPTQKEVLNRITTMLDDTDISACKGTFEKALEDYIDSKSNILSPSTIKSYKQLSKMYSAEFLKTNLFDITTELIQKEINTYAKTHSPKSTRNLNGLIMAVMKLKRPNVSFKITLPQKEEANVTVPQKDDIKKVLEALEGTEYHIPIWLACLGLRRSEICALTTKDLKGTTLYINKALVTDKNNKLVIKTTKTTSSKREIQIPERLAELIREKGYIYKGYPNSILRVLNKTQDELGIPRCKLHELRHFYVSYAHSIGMSDADIIANVGHKTDSIMKNVYRHSMDKDEAQKELIRKMDF